jgi:hypothetical protein
MRREDIKIASWFVPVKRKNVLRWQIHVYYIDSLQLNYTTRMANGKQILVLGFAS